MAVGPGNKHQCNILGQYLWQAELTLLLDRMGKDNTSAAQFA